MDNFKIKYFGECVNSKMEKIKAENIKVGDYIFLTYKDEIIKRYLIIIKDIKVIKGNKVFLQMVYSFYGEDKDKEKLDFNQKFSERELIKDMKNWNCYKLNKVEIQKYKNEIMLMELEK